MQKDICTRSRYLSPWQQSDRREGQWFRPLCQELKESVLLIQTGGCNIKKKKNYALWQNKKNGSNKVFLKSSLCIVETANKTFHNRLIESLKKGASEGRRCKR